MRFPAGGDIQDLYRSMVENDGGENPYAREFFEAEYRLDYLLHQYTKPVIAWANGIVMGGGLGVMAASSHRLGDETTRIAMPEITIGLFPDAGATWFLANMPVHLAHFIAWTGCHLNAVDAKKVGLIDRIVHSKDKDKVMTSLRSHAWDVRDDNHARLDQLLPKLTAKAAGMPDGELDKREIDIASLIGSCMSADRPAIAFNELLDSLDVDNDEWLSRAVSTFRAGSTTTAHIIPEQIRCARGLDLKETFMLELQHCAAVCGSSGLCRRDSREDHRSRQQTGMALSRSCGCTARLGG
ncbi:MAG: enoyl-CoA hydratase/isomerase family protein [Gammaproteobacteria bacterium]|nr:enoyl-CoA hydratase/isomerase family protein [Gammaproteobacteria bacterium]